MNPTPVPSSPVPINSSLTKPSRTFITWKLFLFLAVALVLAYLSSQVLFSEIGAENLPGAMPYVFQQHPGQNLRRLLSNQKIFAIRTNETAYAACLIPKNGCSYHIGLLHRINGVRDYEVLPVVHNMTAKSDLYISRFRNKRITEWLADPAIPRYAVVRNPMIRTLSGYLDKVERHYEEDQKTPDSFERWLSEEFPSGAGRTKPLMLWNPHWRPQFYFCGFRTENVHKAFTLFRFEEPEKIVDYIYGFIPRRFLDDGWGGDENVSLREFMLGPRKRTGGTEDKFLTYFRTVEVFDMLAKELEDDIDSLGYRDEVQSLRKEILRRQEGGLEEND